MPFSLLAGVLQACARRCRVGGNISRICGHVLRMSNVADDEGHVVRIRGLPWSATEENVISFFGEEVRVSGGAEGVHLTLSRDGRPSGEAYVELESQDDLEAARSKHNCCMGHRYIEVFRSKRSEMDWVVKRSGMNRGDPSVEDGCVRLRGLPFGCTKEEVANFFSGLEVVPNGITLPMDGNGRSSGEAYVQFVSREVAEKGLLKNKERIGHRYIEIFHSSMNEVRQAQSGMGRVRPLMMSRPTPYDRGDRWAGSGPGGPGGRPTMYGRGGRRGGFNSDYDDYYDSGPAPPQWGRGPGGPPGGRRGGGGGGGYDSNGPPAQNRAWQSSTGHTVHMRGLPFRSAEVDVFEFFDPHVPVKVHMLFDDMGRPSGQANVDFGTHDEAVQAMQKDKASMGRRYIELFLNSTMTGNYGDGANRGKPVGDFNGGENRFGQQRFGGGYGDDGGFNGQSSNQLCGNNYNSFM